MQQRVLHPGPTCIKIPHCINWEWTTPRLQRSSAFICCLLVQNSLSRAEEVVLKMTTLVFILQHMNVGFFSLLTTGLCQ